MPVILATQEAEIRIVVQSQPEANNISKKKRYKTGLMELLK
jgi:hypothetical protein